MGGGVFYERVATFGIGITSNYTTNPPSLRTATLYYGNVANIATSPGTFFPTAINRLSSDGHVPTVYNYNAGIQRELPWKLFAEVSYVGSQSRHLWLAQPFNLAPFGSAWQPYTQDPTTTPKFDGTTNLPVNMYRPYAGYTDATDYTWGTSNNYNSLQASLNRRVGTRPVRRRVYLVEGAGRLGGPPHGYPRRRLRAAAAGSHAVAGVQLHLRYSQRWLARAFLDNAAAKAVLNGWQFSGLTSMASGAPTNVSYSVSGIGATTLNREITGSEDVAPRVVLTCNPNQSHGDRNIDAFINTSCFAPAAERQHRPGLRLRPAPRPGTPELGHEPVQEHRHQGTGALPASPGSLQRL